MLGAIVLRQYSKYILAYFGFPSYVCVGLCVSFSIRRCWNSEPTQTLWTALDNASLEWCHSIRRVNVMILMIDFDTILFYVLFDFYGSCQTGVPLSHCHIRFLVKCQSNWLLRQVEWGWDQIENIERIQPKQFAVQNMTQYEAQDIRERFDLCWSEKRISNIFLLIVCVLWWLLTQTSLDLILQDTMTLITEQWWLIVDFRMELIH